jgi:hypothetical protein
MPEVIRQRYAQAYATNSFPVFGTMLPSIQYQVHAVHMARK